MSNLGALQERWHTLYTRTLPALAKARDPAQSRWPVNLDHCFARIILDNTIGNGEKQWDKIIAKPAIRNMTEQQLHDAISLGRDIETGKVDLCDLDEISLQCRGKNEGKYRSTPNKRAQSPNKPLTRGEEYFAEDTNQDQASARKKPRLDKQQTKLNFQTETKLPEDKPSVTDVWQTGATIEFIEETINRIRSHPTLTPYRKRLYTTLLSVPRGRYTTYAAMSDYLNSSARAVGNGMRHNPFAPDVPCHRVLAANGTIGGFHGDWGKDGKYANKKIELLRSEGVRFDSSGKVVGAPFHRFHTFEDLR
ncbi:hypothetical protein PV08_10689 [Exophiala spinifera]|uniref:Methylated-DNA--protein-cysteine methyltransferase n=1 Tax=Exophiala spinifera TaxID=91928 RepID=A0A0D2BJ63_9EURO|nr:uncharacterized protein PV08_10689 [Exophiala spinifera]KIW11389.1 hypothetical protein PV08_10689 [Exophiala spinifera]